MFGSGRAAAGSPIRPPSCAWMILLPLLLPLAATLQSRQVPSAPAGPPAGPPPGSAIGAPPKLTVSDAHAAAELKAIGTTNSANFQGGLGPPMPPPCPIAPDRVDPQLPVESNYVPKGATGDPVHLKNGGTAFRLAGREGGWVFNYPKMSIHMKGNQTRLDWAEPPYVVQYGPETTTFHDETGTVTHDITGEVTYHQPEGTIHQDSTTITYHWCNPNVVIYHTPSGIIYHDAKGITYHGPSGITHYESNGVVQYQGEGGVTRQDPDGTVTHWTAMGVIKNQPDGAMYFTPMGEKTPQKLKLLAATSTKRAA